MRHFYLFTLVLIRMAGMMAIGPVFGQSVIPANVRVMLVLAISLLIAPTLPTQAGRAFDRLDANQNGLLTRDEVPEPLVERFESLLARTPKAAGLRREELTFAVPLPNGPADYVLAAAGELALGFALGLGVFTILSGLQIAGELIDQQAGTALGGVFDPTSGGISSLSGRTLSLLGATVFLCLPPINGHLLMIAALVETFQTLPVGAACVSASTVELLRDLVHQSLVLGLQIAAPVLATMSLVALTMGFLGRTVPQMNLLVVGFPIRVLTALLVLALTLSGASRALVDVVPVTIDQLRATLAGF